MLHCISENKGGQGFTEFLISYTQRNILKSIMILPYIYFGSCTFVYRPTYYPHFFHMMYIHKRSHMKNSLTANNHDSVHNVYK